MVYCGLMHHWWQLLHLAVGSPFIAVNYCSRMQMHSIMGNKGAAFRRGTTCMYQRAGEWETSTIPKTQSSVLGALPL